MDRYWTGEGEYAGVIEDDRNWCDRYRIPWGYRVNENPVPHDDRGMKCEWQREVYQYAGEHGTEPFLDLGCGSAWKLFVCLPCHYPENAAVRTSEFIGVEVEPMLAHLRRLYPQHIWRHFDDGPVRVPTVICADVIEHVQDPDAILAYIEGCKPNRVFISTPDRDLVGTPLGPPENPSHVREWSFRELRAYLESHGWKVLEHFHSNREQGTQLAVCEVPK